MRRYVAILMLVCANILLFAHSVVEHHHHRGVSIMFYSDACDGLEAHLHNNHIEHNCHSEEHSHSHEHHSDLEDCNLSNITRPGTVLKQDVNFALLYSTLHNFMLSQLLASDDEVSYGEYLEHNYHSPPIHFSGLRGPPTC